MFLNIFYLFVVGVGLRWVFRHLALRYRFKDIPSPPSYPFIGHLLPFYGVHPSGYYELWRDMCKDYKDQDGRNMFLVWVGHLPILSLRHPEQVEVILSNSKLVKKSRFYYFLKDWMGDALFLSAPEPWREQRKMLTPAFHVQKLSEFADSMAEQAEVLNECIAKRLKDHPNSPIGIHDFVTRCTLETLCETAMGIKIDVQDESHCAYLEAEETYIPLCMLRSASPWYHTDFIYYKTKQGREYKKSVEIMHDFTLNVIRRRQAERAKIKNNSNGGIVDYTEGKKRKAFLDLLLDISEHEIQPLTLEQIREQVDLFMFAGHDTTSTSVVWTLFLLGNNLDIQDKVHKEMDEVFGGHCEGIITQKQLGQLKYLEMVIKESLRIYPSAPIVARSLTEDTWIDGILVPKDTDIAVFIEEMHNNPAVWENPSKFDPDRFLPENSKNRHPYSYIPFSAGPRNCIGQKFGQLHLKSILAALMRKWKVKSLRKPTEVKVKWYLTMTPQEPIEILFTPRF